jgi:hypothetical protein
MGRASFTTTLRPPMSWPFMPLMAACASASLPISTNPKPLERGGLESRSIITLALATVPNWLKALWRSSSRAE